jgi:hypothetical protein
MAEMQPKYAARDADPAQRTDRAELEAEQHREAGSQVSGPRYVSMAAATNSQVKGLAGGGGLGALIGALLFLPLAFIEMGGIPVAGRIAIVVIVGALAGGTAGAVYFGGRQPELDGETVDADGRPSVGSTPRDPGTDDIGRPS